jgi:hypothetical protein
VSASAAFGGMGPTTVTAHGFGQALLGKTWDFDLLTVAYKALSDDMPLPDNVPGGQAQYRRSLPPSFFFKFFIHTCQQLGEAVNEANQSGGGSPLPPAPTVSTRELSAADNFVTQPKPYSEGVGVYTSEKGGLTAATDAPHQELAPSQLSNKVGVASSEKDTRGPVGGAFKHLSAEKQVSGAAEYVDDIPHPPGMLHAALVMSPVPHAVLK